jgi:hypothetical protein
VFSDQHEGTDLMEMERKSSLVEVAGISRSKH